MNMTNALATRHANDLMPDTASWQMMLEMAKALVESGMLPTAIKTPQAAVAVIQKGRELGIPPMHSLSSIVVISGKPTASAELMAALIYRDHGDDALRYLESSSERCVISYKRRSWRERSTFAFTMDDAKRAGVTGNQNWQKYPAAMLRARAISAVARMAFPDTIGGMYTPEELGATVAVTGDEDFSVLDVPEDAPIRPVTEILSDSISGPVDPETGEILPPDEAEGFVPEPRDEVLASLREVSDRRDLAAIKVQIRELRLHEDEVVTEAYRKAFERLQQPAMV